MSRRKSVKLLIPVVVLAATLGFGSLPARQANAAQCCETCDAGETTCQSRLHKAPCFGDATCCFNQWAGCYSHCIICS